MRITISAVAFAAVTLAACARQTRFESGGEVDLGTVPVDARTLPSGTTIDARLDQAIGTKVSKVGDEFTATVEQPVVAQNGQTVVPSGAKVRGRVTALDDSDHAGEQAAIKIDLERLEINGRSFPLAASVTTTRPQTTGADTRDETLKKAGIGAAAGAVLGAVLSGGDLQKILIGGALGAAAGTVISLGTGNVDAVLPAGTKMTLRTTQTVALR
jgi:hypothetical protein